MAGMTAKQARMKELAEAAAALDEGKDPFETWFWTENHVTLDEAYEFAEMTAMALRMAFRLPLFSDKG